jgi:triacylglycerol lipase
MKRLTVLSALALAGMLSTGAAVAQTEPIIFVHGYVGSNSNWSTMMSRFRADGYQ